LVRPRRLDLTLPATEPLAEVEALEMVEHLAFLRANKTALRLSLNAQEDLLVNGAKAPSDRGLCRHLLSKVDRASIERALARDALVKDPSQRSRFLAGAIRIVPDEGLLLRYLETLSELPDRREAARAFRITVDRIDFTSLKAPELGRLLGIVAKTFSGHDRVQVFFGLLDHEALLEGLTKALAGLDPELEKMYQALSAVHRAINRGMPRPEDDQSALDAGLLLLLSAPDAVLRSHPEHVRARLLDLALKSGVKDRDEVREAARRLLDSLPKKDEGYTKLRVARAEQLLRNGDQAARALIQELANADVEWAEKRREALGWPAVGPLRVSPASTPGRLSRALWLEGGCFAWARTGPPEQAGKISIEARLQAELLLPGVSPVLTHGLAKDGQVYVVIAGGGRPLARLPELAAFGALELASFGTRLLRALAAFGLELPDLEPTRFLELRGALSLADFDGARSQEPGAATIAHGALAARWCRKVLLEGAKQIELSAALREKLDRPTPLALLAKVLAEESARIDPLSLS
jgi:hypothetical protein